MGIKSTVHARVVQLFQNIRRQNQTFNETDLLFLQNQPSQHAATQQTTNGSTDHAGVCCFNFSKFYFCDWPCRCSEWYRGTRGRNSTKRDETHCPQCYSEPRIAQCYYAEQSLSFVSFFEFRPPPSSVLFRKTVNRTEDSLCLSFVVQKNYKKQVFESLFVWPFQSTQERTCEQT